MKELSLEQLIEGRKKAFLNAADLIADAETLFNNQRWARCIFLTCIAIEEFGKYLMIIGAIGRLLKGDIDWNRFWKRFRSHQEKSGNIMVFDAMISPFVSHEHTIASLLKSREHTVNQEEEKLSSLYVDFISDSFVLPMDQAQEEDAQKALDSAKSVLKFFEFGEIHAFSKMSPTSVTPEKFAEAAKSIDELIKKAENYYDNEGKITDLNDNT
jgi:AbiV family abortive infection protein